MTESLLSSEPAIRLGFFLGVFLAIALWEIFVPRRKRAASRWQRWPGNLGVMLLNTLTIRVVTPTAVIGLTLVAAERGWGLFNYLDVSFGLAVAASVIALDFAIYVQHLLFHAVPVLWRLHRMHHADLDVDVTTGVRFHPFEMIISMGFKFIVVIALGPPAVAVLIFEVLLSATSLFNHGNVRIALPLDRALRWLVVTPDMHRIHHSVHSSETNSNFGFNLTWWDRFFGTYRVRPADGHEAMTVGTSQFREIRDLRIDRMLLQPFVDNQ